jgi:acyl dehydratase
MKYYDDIVLNCPRFSPRTHTVTADEIKRFAGEWDPMPFHVDEEIAKLSPIGKLFASSIHTVAIGLRLSHDMMEKDIAVIAGLGWNDLKFPKPVFAGDSLRLKSQIIDKRESKSKPDRGIIISLNEVYNQNDDLVAEYKITTLMFKNPTGV